MIWGKAGCRNDWEVSIFFNDDTDLIISEQLTEPEATEFYEKIKREFDKKNPTMEIKFNGKLWYINKINISAIRLA